VIRNGICHSIKPGSFEKNGCLDIRRKNIQIWGDSYAAALYPGLSAVRDRDHPDFGLIQTTDGNGPPFFNQKKTDDGKTLAQANEFRLEVARKVQPDVIVIAWHMNTDKPAAEFLGPLNETLNKISQAAPKAQIVVMGPAPLWSGSLLKQLIDHRKARGELPPLYMKHGLLAKGTGEWDAYLKSHLTHQNLTYVSSLDLMCTQAGCLTRTSDSLKDITAVDWGHLTPQGSTYLMDKASSTIFR
jgi:hypothetical protein